MGKLDEPLKEGGLITKGDMRMVFWRSFPLQASFNYERMQNVGFCYSMLPVLRRLYHNKEDMSAALKRHLSFFNTTPQVVTFITGACVAMEEENAKAQSEGKGFDIESIAGLKAALMGPVAGIGDSFFWGTFRVIAAGVGCSLAMQGSILGAILFMLIFNVPALLARFYGLKISYKSGVDFIDSMQESGTISLLTECSKVLGLCVVGAMIASMVTFSTPLVITIGDASVELQSIFDEILPGVLPLGLTFACFGLLKRGTSSTVIMFGLIVLGILGAAVGVL